MTQAPTVGTYLALFFMCLWASGYSDMAASKSPFERMKRLVNPLQTTSAVRLFPSPPLSASKLKKDQIKFFFKNNAIIEPSAKIYWYLKLSALIKKKHYQTNSKFIKTWLTISKQFISIKKLSALSNNKWPHHADMNRPYFSKDTALFECCQDDGVVWSSHYIHMTLAHNVHLLAHFSLHTR